jgi:hypothetical protein
VLRISCGNSLRSLLTVSSSGATGSHEQAKTQGETMSSPDQAAGYDGEPTYAQDEYLRWREDTEPQTR